MMENTLLHKLTAVAACTMLLFAVSVRPARGDDSDDNDRPKAATLWNWNGMNPVSMQAVFPTANAEHEAEKGLKFSQLDDKDVAVEAANDQFCTNNQTFISIVDILRVAIEKVFNGLDQVVSSLNSVLPDLVNGISYSFDFLNNSVINPLKGISINLGSYSMPTVKAKTGKFTVPIVDYKFTVMTGLELGSKKLDLESVSPFRNLPLVPKVPQFSIPTPAPMAADIDSELSKISCP
jgi:hypothetical protein